MVTNALTKLTDPRQRVPLILFSSCKEVALEIPLKNFLRFLIKHQMK